MNRRTLLKLPAAAALPAANWNPAREIRVNLRVNGDALVHMIIAAHGTESAAERHRDFWVGNPFESYGEWYLQTSERRPLPDHLERLPATLTHHTALVGEAAEEWELLVAALRREHISCIVRMRQADKSLMMAILKHIANTPVPGLLETAWSSAQLHGFVPSSADIDLDVEPHDAFWP